MESLSKGASLKNDLPSSFKLKSLHGRLDVSKPIIAGHSLGGATAILSLSKDKRFK